MPSSKQPNQQPVERRYVSVREGMLRYGGCSRQKFYDDMASGLVVAVKNGGRTLVDVIATDRNYAALPRPNVHVHARARRRAEKAQQSA